tara:strand:- start:22097 stop:22462 length:366 start_codon:yes stop_codon:yes gene_type:complete
MKLLNLLFITSPTFLDDYIEIYGLEKTKLVKIFTENGVNPVFKHKNLKKLKLRIKILRLIKRQTLGNIHGIKRSKKNLLKIYEFLWKIRSFKGLRHKLHLPARGQRSKTNGRTKKNILLNL